MTRDAAPLATENGHKDVVDVLLARSANIKARGDYNIAQLINRAGGNYAHAESNHEGRCPICFEEYDNGHRHIFFNFHDGYAEYDSEHGYQSIDDVPDFWDDAMAVFRTVMIHGDSLDLEDDDEGATGSRLESTPALIQRIHKRDRGDGDLYDEMHEILPMPRDLAGLDWEAGGAMFPSSSGTVYFTADPEEAADTIIDALDKATAWLEKRGWDIEMEDDEDDYEDEDDDEDDDEDE